MVHPLLTAPIGRSLMQLGKPTTIVVMAQTAVAIVEIYCVGRLGTDALAGFALVLPFVMLMVMMAAGGIGGGIASAMARALGAGRQADARALVLHSLLVALAFAVLFTAAAWFLGPTIYWLLGGRDVALAEAILYSNVLFAAAPATWANYAIASLLRGGGDAKTPGRYMLWGALLQAPLFAILMLGIGDWQGLGMAGPGLAALVTSTAAALLQARILWLGKLGFRPSLTGIHLEWRLFWLILNVGLLASLSTVITNVTTILVTGLVGLFGATALAGYGIAVRLELMLVSLLFGLGTALTTLVGVAVGGREWRRAVMVTWVGAAAAGAILGVLGLVAIALSGLWMRLYSQDPQVVAIGTSYFAWVAPAYAALGAGLCISMASQGAGRMRLPLAAGLARLCVAVLGGWYAASWLNWQQDGVFGAVCASLLVYLATMAVPLAVKPWCERGMIPPRRDASVRS